MSGRWKFWLIARRANYFGFVESFSHDHEMLVAHHFPDQHRQTLSKHQRKKSAKAAETQASASAAKAKTERALHTVHANSFVDFGGSDSSNR